MVDLWFHLFSYILAQLVNTICLSGAILFCGWHSTLCYSAAASGHHYNVQLRWMIWSFPASRLPNKASTVTTYEWRPCVTPLPPANPRISNHCTPPPMVMQPAMRTTAVPLCQRVTFRCRWTDFDTYYRQRNGGRKGLNTTCYNEKRQYSFCYIASSFGSTRLQNAFSLPI